jgi:ubiquinone/menaquinone biosynthesis C-methylase UbiE
MKNSNCKSSKTSIFDTDAKSYDLWFEKHSILFQNEVNAIQMLLPKSGKGLEIGVGTGRFAHALSLKEGLEPSKEMAKIAKLRGIKVREGMAEALPYEEQSFDFLLMVTTLCFLEDIPKAFAEAHRVLKKNGHLIIGLIDKNSPMGQRYQQEKENNPWYKNACFQSTEESTMALFKAGFSDFKYYQTLISTEEFPEKPVSGFGKGSFVVIQAKK